MAKYNHCSIMYGIKTAVLSIDIHHDHMTDVTNNTLYTQIDAQTGVLNYTRLEPPPLLRWPGPCTSTVMILSLRRVARTSSNPCKRKRNYVYLLTALTKGYHYFTV